MITFKLLYNEVFFYQITLLDNAGDILKWIQNALHNHLFQFKLFLDFLSILYDYVLRDFKMCVEHNNYLYMQFNIQITKQLYNSNFSHLKWIIIIFLVDICEIIGTISSTITSNFSYNIYWKIHTVYINILHIKYIMNNI